MKRIIVILVLMIAIIVIGLTSCGEDKGSSSSSDCRSVSGSSSCSISISGGASSSHKDKGDISSNSSSDLSSSKGLSKDKTLANSNTTASSANKKPNSAASSKANSTSSVSSSSKVTSSVTSTANTINGTKICPICGINLNADGSCNTIHDYTGYGHCIYEGGVVYIVCDTCGGRWNRDSYGSPQEWANAHAINCYNEHNKSYIICDYCGKTCEEGTMYKGMYCSRECLIGSGMYCPNCESELYRDGCHACGYGRTCSRCGQPISSECNKRYCTTCASHAGHTASDHCRWCNTVNCTATHCPECGSVEHSSHLSAEDNSIGENTEGE